MAQFRSIEIDFDVHQVIEIERHGFDEKPNDVLRRLLKIDKDTPASPVPVSANSAGRQWSGKGVTLSHGTELRMKYNGKQHFGKIDDGEWAVEGKRFRSQSAAAGGVALTKSGRKTSLDGWIYWEVKRPGDHGWTPITALRPDAAR